MKLPAYPRYKDTGNEFVQHIPQHWGLQKLKHLVDESRPITYGIVQAGEDLDGGIPYIRPTDMEDERGVPDIEALLKTAVDIARAYARSTIREGDLVCSIGPSFGKVMVTPPALAGANLTQGTARIAVAPQNCSRFVFWALRATTSNSQWLASVGGATFRALNLGPLEETWLAVPPRSEQEAIVAFLDRETERIDGLIAEQEKLMALLAEKRQATIAHAVSRGLKPDAPLKPSGIVWLGDMPAHWSTTPLARIALDRCDGPFGSGIKSEHYTDDGALVVRLQNIRAGAFNRGEPVYLDASYFLAELQGHDVVGGDLLVAGLGDENNLLGRACVAPPGLGLALVKADCFRFRLDNDRADPSFIAWQLSAGAAYDAGVLATGTTRSRIPLGTMASRKVALPPLSEQLEITAFIACENEKLDSLAAEAARAVVLLKERRAAVIGAAITGLIDVRGTGVDRTEEIALAA